MSNVKYVDPPWAMKPNATWILSEIKDGNVVNEHEISQQACTVIGRNEDMAHIVQHHASISRQHARLAFDSAGTLWIKDLSSTHGVTVNKKRLPLKSIGTNESMSTQPGTRGVVLNSGDFIQLGASTRTMVVEKVSEADSEPTVSVPLPIEQSFDKKVMNDAIEHDVDEDDDTYNDADATNRLNPNMTFENIPPELRNEWQKLEALKMKLENISQESERIRSKESSQEQLSVGQERQLQRNQERIDDLQHQIATRENVLYSKIHPEKKRIDVRGKSSVEENLVDDDDDDFFDRTQNHKDHSSNDVETEESLLVKWNQLLEKRSILFNKIKVAQRNLHVVQERIDLMKDSEDIFFAQNELSLARDKVNKLKSEISNVMVSLKSTKELLQITSPRLILNVETGNITDGKKNLVTSIDHDHKPNSVLTDKVAKEPATIENKPVNSSRIKRDIEKFNDDFPIPNPVLPTAKSTTSSVKVEKKIGPMLPPHNATSPSISMPAPPSIAMTAPPCMAMPAPPSIAMTAPPSIAIPAPPPKKDANKRMMGATLLFLPNAFPTSVTSTNSENVDESTDKTVTISNKKQRVVVPITKAIMHDAEDATDIDTWHAPEGQDGSGVTKLNAKFQGRY